MGCVPVDRQARPLRNAIIWADMRAEEEARAIIDGVGWSRPTASPGTAPAPPIRAPRSSGCATTSRRSSPRPTSSSTPKTSSSHGSTGNFVTDRPDASGMNLYDLRAGDWSDRILDASRARPRAAAGAARLHRRGRRGHGRGRGRSDRPGGRHAGGDRRRRRVLRGHRRGRGARGQRLQLHRLVVLDRARLRKSPFSIPRCGPSRGRISCRACSARVGRCRRRAGRTSGCATTCASRRRTRPPPPPQPLRAHESPGRRVRRRAPTGYYSCLTSWASAARVGTRRRVAASSA